MNSDRFHTNIIKSVWSHVKMWFGAMHRDSEIQFDHYMCEFMLGSITAGEGLFG